MSRIIILDRDGVLNRVVVDEEHGTIDSPLHPSQVQLIDGVPEALSKLSSLGYALHIATNQPAAAKHKTTLQNLEDTHARVIELVQAAGARITSSHLCFHRSEDGCLCRKPNIGLLEEIASGYGHLDKVRSWMVGDGVTDVRAGQRFGLSTAFIGPHKCDACQVFGDAPPSHWSDNLPAFADWLANSSREH